MKEKIIAALRQLEKERDCRMLFAVESGSRAWGFASPDPSLDELLKDRFEELHQIKWPERSGGDVLSMLTDVFRRYVKFD